MTICRKCKWLINCIASVIETPPELPTSYPDRYEEATKYASLIFEKDYCTHYKIGGDEFGRS